VVTGWAGTAPAESWALVMTARNATPRPR
jgi:hypothetical protein